MESLGKKLWISYAGQGLTSILKSREEGKYFSGASQIVTCPLKMLKRLLAYRYTYTSGKLHEETFASKARLILHFDINKTVIMLDKAQVRKRQVSIQALASSMNLQPLLQKSSRQVLKV